MLLAACHLDKATVPATSTAMDDVLVIEGDVDDGERYSRGPALGRPPSADALAAGGNYLQSLAERLQPAWSSFVTDCSLRLPGDHAFNQENLVVALDLGLSLDGRLLGVKVLSSSGNPAFDEVAVEIAREQNRFEAPPAEWRSDDERVHVLWRFARGKRQAGPATAAMQRITLPLREAIPVLLASGQVSQAARRILMAGANAEVDALLDQVAVGALRSAIESSDPTAAALAIHTAAATRSTGLTELIREVAVSGLPHRVAALSALGQLGGEQDLEYLEGVARGEKSSSEGSAAAASALSRLGHTTDAAAEALRMLTNGNDDSRWAAIAVLSQIPSKEAVPLLIRIQASKKTVRAERVAAITALGRQAITSNAAARALMTGTTARDAAVAAACVQALADAAEQGLQSKAAYAASVRQLKHKDERVRVAAIFATARLEPTRFAKLLPKLRPTGVDELLALASVLDLVLGREALARLVRLSASADAMLRATAATALAKRPEPVAKETLRGLLGDSSDLVRVAAVSGLPHEAVIALLTDSSADVQAAVLHKSLVHDRAAAHKAVALRFSSAGTQLGQQVLWARAWLTSRR